MAFHLTDLSILTSVIVLVFLSAILSSSEFPTWLNISTAQTANHLVGKNFVLLNTSNTEECPEFYKSANKNINQLNEIYSSENIIFENGNNTATSIGTNNDTITSFCPFLKVVYPFDCSTEQAKIEEIMCRPPTSESDGFDDGKQCSRDPPELSDNKEEEEEEVAEKDESRLLPNSCNPPDNKNASSNPRIYDPRTEDVLDKKIFDKEGYLIADTRFDKEFSYELGDPLNPNKTLGINLDLAEHSQGNLNDINSPRIEIARKNLDGTLDMNSAKNQMIVWKGDILNYFEKPEKKYENETYIEIMFNTGHHNSDASDAEKRGIGVLFDVSNGSNPYILDYRDNGKYVKLTMNDVKNLSGADFIFHSNDNQSDNYYINDLINNTDVTLKVKTYLTGENNRVIQTFIDPGTGSETPYWTLNNVSKLQGHEDIDDKDAFLQTINQGSGHTYVRTDNIETRLASLQSIIIDPNNA